MKKVFYLIFLVPLFTNCSDNPAGNEDTNHPPQIVSLVANPDSIDTGTTTILTCNATDSDGDNLSFVWDAVFGSINGSGNNVNWVPPGTAGAYYVKCKVLDGNGEEDIDSVIIFVAQQLPTQGLVAYYPFNGNANDESGNGINGTVIGATLTTDRFGNGNLAYNFDGQNDYIEADASNLPTGERTISLWFYANSVDNRPGLLGYGGGGGQGTTWFMGLNVNGFRSFHMSCHWLINRIDYYYTNPPVAEWYHWVITTNSSGTKIYVNGIVKKSNTTFVNNTFVNGKELGIGVISSTTGSVPYTDGNVKYFSGSIDDIRIYNRALTDDEIVTLYHEGGW
jgi:trimeric autotransporter adhesin